MEKLKGVQRGGVGWRGTMMWSCEAEPFSCYVSARQARPQRRSEADGIWVSYVLLGHVSWQHVSWQRWWSLSLLLASALGLSGLHEGFQFQPCPHCNNSAVIFSTKALGLRITWLVHHKLDHKDYAVQAWHCEQTGSMPSSSLTPDVQHGAGYDVACFAARKAKP